MKRQFIIALSLLLISTLAYSQPYETLISELNPQDGYGGWVTQPQQIFEWADSRKKLSTAQCPDGNPCLNFVTTNTLKIFDKIVKFDKLITELRIKFNLYYIGEEIAELTPKFQFYINGVQAYVFQPTNNQNSVINETFTLSFPTPTDYFLFTVYGEGYGMNQVSVQGFNRCGENCNICLPFDQGSSCADRRSVTDLVKSFSGWSYANSDTKFAHLQVPQDSEFHPYNTISTVNDKSYLGRMHRHQFFKKTFILPKATKKIGLSIIFYQIDRWEGEQFLVRVNGKIAIQKHSQYHEAKIKDQEEVEKGLGNQRFDDTEFQLSSFISFEEETKEITIVITSTLDQGSGDESYALRDLKIIGLNENTDIVSGPAGTELVNEINERSIGVEGWQNHQHPYNRCNNGKPCLRFDSVQMQENNNHTYLPSQEKFKIFPLHGQYTNFVVRLELYQLNETLDSEENLFTIEFNGIQAFNFNSSSNQEGEVRFEVELPAVVNYIQFSVSGKNLGMSNLVISGFNRCPYRCLSCLPLNAGSHCVDQAEEQLQANLDEWNPQLGSFDCMGQTVNGQIEMGQVYTKTFKLGKPSTIVGISFLLKHLGTWEDEEFILKINGQETLIRHIPHEEVLRLNPQPLCGSGNWQDQEFKLGSFVTYDEPITEIVVEISSPRPESQQFQAFGIFDFSVFGWSDYESSLENLQIPHGILQHWFTVRSVTIKQHGNVQQLKTIKCDGNRKCLLLRDNYSKRYFKGYDLHENYYTNFLITFDLYYLGAKEDKTFHLNVNGVEKVYELTNSFGDEGSVETRLELPTAENYLSLTFVGFNYAVKNLVVRGFNRCSSCESKTCYPLNLDSLCINSTTKNQFHDLHGNNFKGFKEIQDNTISRVHQQLFEQEHEAVREWINFELDLGVYGDRPGVTIRNATTTVFQNQQWLGVMHGKNIYTKSYNFVEPINHLGISLTLAFKGHWNNEDLVIKVNGQKVLSRKFQHKQNIKEVQLSAFVSFPTPLISATIEVSANLDQLAENESYMIRDLKLFGWNLKSYEYRNSLDHEVRREWMQNWHQVDHINETKIQPLECSYDYYYLCVPLSRKNNNQRAQREYPLTAPATNIKVDLELHYMGYNINYEELKISINGVEGLIYKPRDNYPYRATFTLEFPSATSNLYFQVEGDEFEMSRLRIEGFNRCDDGCSTCLPLEQGSKCIQSLTHGKIHDLYGHNFHNWKSEGSSEVQNQTFTCDEFKSLGKLNKEGSYSKTFILDEDVSQVGIVMKFMRINHWDNDDFILKVNGKEVIVKSIQDIAQDSKKIECNSTEVAQLELSAFVVLEEIVHSVSVEFEADSGQNDEEEQFAVRDLKIYGWNGPHGHIDLNNHRSKVIKTLVSGDHARKIDY